MARILIVAAVVAATGWLGYSVFIEQEHRPAAEVVEVVHHQHEPSYDPEQIKFLLHEPKGWFTFAASMNDDLPGQHKSAHELALSTLDLTDTARAYTRGERLTARHCGACHIPPTIDDLPRDAWVELFQIKRHMFSSSGILRSTLPPEGYRIYQELTMGRKGLWDAPYPEYALAVTEFVDIVYYHVTASRTDRAPTRAIESRGNAPFDLSRVEPGDWQQGGFMLSAILDDGNILLGRAMNPALIVMSPAGNIKSELALPGVPTGFTRGFDGYHYVTMITESMPTMLYPEQGSVVRLRYEEGSFHGAHTVLAGLNRPVRIHFTDISGNKTEEMLVLEFGWLTGGVSVYEYGLDNDQWSFVQRIVDAPGVVGLASHDFKGDGRQDLVILLSQAEQTLNFFHNQGEGQFRREVLFQKPPGYGFNSLTLADITGNGAPDIVTTNGDNFDLTTQPLKPEHGVRVFRNNGQNEFDEYFFYPMYGAIEAKVGDFNFSGKSDIVAISVFPNTRNPETFVYLKQDAEGGFSAHHLEGGPREPWVSMTIGDMDGLRSPAILLTSFSGRSPSSPSKSRVVLLETEHH